MSLADHWNDRYENNPASRLSWFQESSPEVEFITLNVGKATPVIDIGGGLSPLVHQLIDEEFTDLTVVDVSEFALEQGKERLKAVKSSGSNRIFVTGRPRECMAFGMIGRFFISSQIRKSRSDIY